MGATGKQLAQTGIDKALDHAEREHAGWPEHAFELLQSFLKRKKRKEQFRAEDIYAWAYEQGLPKPPDSRAWGGTIRRAVRAGLIEKRGYGPVKAPSGHCRPVNVWGRV